MSEQNVSKHPPDLPTDKSEFWILRLYVAGHAMRSLTAIANLQAICEEHLPDKHHIEVIDVIADPERASTDQILALPTLIRALPPPVRKIIGDLSNTERVLVGLEIAQRSH